MARRFNLVSRAGNRGQPVGVRPCLICQAFKVRAIRGPPRIAAEPKDNGLVDSSLDVDALRRDGDRTGPGNQDGLGM